MPRVFLCCLALLFLLGCEQNPNYPAGTEAQRVTSPDGVVDAVLVHYDNSALESESYRVFIVPKGASTSKEYSHFLADKTEKIGLSWKPKKVLEIHYDKARIFEFSNFWQSAKVNNFGYLVELRLDLKSTSAIQ